MGQTRFCSLSGLYGYLSLLDLLSGSFRKQIVLLGRSPHSVTLPFQDDKCPLNCCKIKLQKKMFKRLDNLRKQRGVNADSNDAIMTIKRVKQEISKMSVKGDQDPLFPMC